MAYPNPIRRNPNSRPLRPRMQRQNLRNITPRNTIHRRPKNQHVHEEKRHGRRRRRMLIRLPLETKQNSHHHHADTQSKRSPHHGLAAADAVDENSGEEGAEDEHDLDAAADDLGEVFGKADVGV